MISICKQFHFDSAHHLPNHPGKCRNLHGHRWFLDVEISGDVRKDTGMLMDFSDLKILVKEVVIDDMDHHYLNDLYENPTAECMVIQIASKLASVLEPFTDITLQRVRLFETPEAYAEWKL